MPLARIGSKLVYFAHIPKCAGTAIEDYLQDRFGPLALLDRGHLMARTRWTRSSPQHVVWADLKRLFPDGFFEAGFAVVRHPTMRLRSVFHWQRDWERAIPADTTLEGFVDMAARMRRNSATRFDNHLRPMHRFVPEETSSQGFRIFRLEDGLTPLIGWLDRIAGHDDGPRQIAFRNETAQRLGTGFQPAPVSDATHARIAALYADDFARFGYDPDVNPLKEARP